jgi:2-dehydropantoate 2-reductase
MRILVVGAGAVGGYFGGRLAQAGREVTFLVREKRAEILRVQGLQIVSQAHGDFTVHPKAITAAQIESPYDIVLVSVKSYDLAAAIRDFAPAVGPKTAIIPVLNGMQHMDVLAQRFGNAVLGGVCYVATEVDSQGRIVQLASFQGLTYGELDGTKSPRIEAVHKALSGAGFDAKISREISRAMWEKWVLLASVGAITCLLRGSIGEIAAIPGGAEISLSILRECVAIAAACGYTMPEEFVGEKSRQLTASGSTLTSSMYRDLSGHARVEVDTILGDFLEHGRRQGVTAPLVQAAFVNLSVYQQRLARAKSAAS